MQQNHKERGVTICYEQYQTLLCSDLHLQINNKYAETQNKNLATHDLRGKSQIREKSMGAL